MANTYQPIITNGAGSISASAFATPILGACYAAVASLAYTNAGVAKALFTIPDTAVIIDWILNVTTAFNSSGTDLVGIGVSGTQTKFAATVDVSATGLKTVGVVLTQVGNAQSGDQAVTALYTQSVADSSAGAMVIIVRYVIPS